MQTEFVLAPLGAIALTQNWAVTSHFTSFSCLHSPGVHLQLVLHLLRENNSQVGSGLVLAKLDLREKGPRCEPETRN